MPAKKLNLDQPDSVGRLEWGDESVRLTDISVRTAATIGVSLESEHDPEAADNQRFHNSLAGKGIVGADLAVSEFLTLSGRIASASRSLRSHPFSEPCRAI
jgi:hypothetical protein